ncbi:MAG: HNH endonuclease [Clostridia bacterium]|nr:HNH endonuclease [Clostridia bacterium]
MNLEIYKDQKNGRRAIPKRCSNCGTLFAYVGSHASRNQDFFCSNDCYIAFKTKKEIIQCEWCGTTFNKKRSDIKRTNHNFCCANCALAFRQKEGETAWNHRVNGQVFHRQIAEEKIGRKLHPWEEVHHIDGDHFNNDPSNIMVLSKSEHSKVHASWKERSQDGKFIRTNNAP